MARNPLNGDGRRNGVNEIVNWKGSRFDEIRASHTDLLSVQKSMEIEG